MSDQPRLIPNGTTHHFVVSPPIDHGQMQVRSVEVKITPPMGLDRRSNVTLRGPHRIGDNTVTRSHFKSVVMLAALPDELYDAIREAMTGKATR